MVTIQLTSDLVGKLNSYDIYFPGKRSHFLALHAYIGQRVKFQGDGYYRVNRDIASRQ